MMNDMMEMDGDLDDMGMNMSLNQMDMNVVMYPEMSNETMHENKHQHHPMDLGDDHKSGDSIISKNIVTLNYAMLKSPNTSSLPNDAPIQQIKFTLTGNMNRYVWSIDNRVLSESDKIPVKKGEILRIILLQQFDDETSDALAW